MEKLVGPLVSKPDFTEAEITGKSVRHYDRYRELAARVKVLEREKEELKKGSEALSVDYAALKKKYGDVKSITMQLVQELKSIKQEIETLRGLTVSRQDMDLLKKETIKKEEASRQSLNQLPVMANAVGFHRFIWETHGIKRSDIQVIIFLDSIALSPVDAWDVSAAGDRSVLAWLENKNILYIAGEGGVRANGNCTSMFEGYENLRIIRFGKRFDTSGVKSMRKMFKDCTKLTEVDVSNFDTSDVGDMGYMFANCRNLIRLEVSGFDTSNVTGMRYMFANCENLIGLDVSKFNTSKVTDMEYMFLNCKSLTKLDALEFDTSNVEKMKYMFQGTIWEDESVSF